MAAVPAFAQTTYLDYQNQQEQGEPAESLHELIEKTANPSPVDDLS